MSKKITFRMHAYSDAAGKYNPEATRDGNEDNFYVDDNLCDELPSHCESDVVKELCDLGLIMAVADGMGGMNAGEVASEIAVETIQEFFSPGKITEDNAKDHQSRKKYLEKLIVEADSRIKSDSKNNPEHEGMGSTIILAWIVGDQLTLSWCGDSRAYRYNPAFGIELISEDHSYVQELVKQGVLTYDQTFEHPQGNIITRSLGDETKKAQPETRFYDVYNDDIILLCSDGLSGVLRDRKTRDGEGGYFPGNNIEDIVRENSHSLVGCREALWQAAQNADWYDNVTAILCEIKSGANIAPAYKIEDSERSTDLTDENVKKHWWTKSIIKLSPKSLSFIFIVLVLVVAISFGGYKGYMSVKNRFVLFVRDTVSVQDTLSVQDTVSAVIQKAIYGIVHESEDSVNIEKPNIPSQSPPSNVSASEAQEKKSNGNEQTYLHEKAGDIPQSTRIPSGGETVPEISPAPEELTEASSESENPASKKMVVVDSFLLKHKKIVQGDTYSNLKRTYIGEEYHELVILDNSMGEVPVDGLKAGETYTLVLIFKSSNLSELFSLFKKEGSRLYDDKGEEVSIGEKNTVKDFLKSVEIEHPYNIFRVE